MSIELVNWEYIILNEIKGKQFKQKDIAQTYAIAMKSFEDVDWGKINRAIIERWSLSGLNRIKEMAWSGKCFQEMPEGK